MEPHTDHLQARDLLRRDLLKALGVAAVAMSGVGSAGVAHAQVAGDSVQTMLDIAITAEALATTLVHGVVTRSTFTAASYSRGCVTGDLNHGANSLRSFAAQGGKPLLTQFFIPNGLLESVPLLVSVGDFLETTCIGAYLAATRRSAELNMP